MSSDSAFERLGGEAAVRAIVADFVDRVVADPMIGFFFARVDVAAVKQREYELAARHLGADIPYSGRPLPDAHGAHGIRGGHFMRRLRLLEETLEAHGVPADLIQAWVKNNEALRGAITSDPGGECVEAVAKPVPTPEQISAYLEESARRTKKRLSLVGSPGAGEATSSSSGARALPVLPKK